MHVLSWNWNKRLWSQDMSIARAFLKKYPRWYSLFYGIEDVQSEIIQGNTPQPLSESRAMALSV